jgi:multiple antibiotic resistance protein
MESFADLGGARLAFKAFLTLFVTIDPIGMAPLFMALAGSRTSDERSHIARKAVLVAGGVLLSFAVGGDAVLRHLGITLDAFRVAGGILLLLIAIDMVLAQHERETEEEAAESRSRKDITVFPVAIPLIAGPAGLTSVMILAAESKGQTGGLAIVIATCVAVLAMCYAALRLSGPLARILGLTGVNVITRILGILLAALAIQYIGDGVRSFLKVG